MRSSTRAAQSCWHAPGAARRRCRARRSSSARRDGSPVWAAIPQEEVRLIERMFLLLQADRQRGPCVRAFPPVLGSTCNDLSKSGYKHVFAGKQQREVRKGNPAPAPRSREEEQETRSRWQLQPPQPARRKPAPKPRANRLPAKLPRPPVAARAPAAPRGR